MAVIGRRQFSAALIGGSAVIWLSGCGGDPDTELEELDGNVRISSNHGHLLVIPPEDLNSIVAKIYDIRGNVQDHTHQLIVNADQFRRIKEGQVVAIGSGLAIGGGDVHSHTITANPVI